MRRYLVGLVAVCVLGAVHSRAAEGPARQPVVAGGLALNPHYILAVYRPIEHQGVAVVVGRPGQAVQTIVVSDAREGAEVFDALWKNEQVTKNPGDADGRPLTRMMLRNAEAAAPALIVNVERVLAIKWDANRRTASVFLDVPAGSGPLIEPNTGEERGWLDLGNDRRQGEAVVEAYKACVLSAGREK